MKGSAIARHSAPFSFDLCWSWPNSVCHCVCANVFKRFLRSPLGLCTIDAISGDCKQVLQGDEYGVYALAVVHDGLVVSGGGGGCMKMWVCNGGDGCHVTNSAQQGTCIT